jgi:hypothetical protein
MECVCGHVEDEHDAYGECEVDDCPCFHFEAAGDPKEDERA